MVIEHWCFYIAPVCSRSVFPFSAVDTNGEMEKGSLFAAFIDFPMTAVGFFFLSTSISS